VFQRPTCYYTQYTLEPPYLVRKSILKSYETESYGGW